MGHSHVVLLFALTWISPVLAVALPMPPYITSTAQESHPHVAAGFLDASLYNGWQGNPVDPTGVEDSTVALQKVLDDAYEYSLAAYLPPGIYLVSDTLRGDQIFQASGCAEHVAYTSARNIRKAPILVGATPRPTLRLADSSAGFGNPGSPKAVVAFRNYNIGTGETDWVGDADCAMDLVFRNIDIEVGNGNPGAVGLQMPSAQYSTIEDVRINATGGYCGLRGPVTTNAMVNIEIVGGQYGVRADICCGIAIANLTLRDQTVAALYVDTYGTVTVTGFSIDAPAAKAVEIESCCGHTGAITMLDGSIVTGSATSAIDNPDGRNVVLGNVYVNLGGPLAQNRGNQVLVGSGWQRISEYAFTEPTVAHLDASTDVESFTLIDGVVSKDERLSAEASSAPPADLGSRHGWTALPLFNEAKNVRDIDIGAIGDGIADDTAALQTAIDAYTSVFLPRGDYQLTTPLRLHADTRLLGVPGSRSRLHGSNWDPAGQFEFFIETDDAATGTTYLGDLKIVLPPGFDASYLGAVEWRVGRASLVRQLSADMTWEADDQRTSVGRRKYVFRDGGGGRWYGLTSGANSRSQNPDYRILWVDGTTEPLTMYGPNFEHGRGDVLVETTGASNVRILGTKTETNAFAWFIGGANVGLAGLTGNGAPDDMVIFNSVNGAVAANVTFYAQQHTRAVAAMFLELPSTVAIDGSDNVTLYRRGTFDSMAFPRCGDGICDPYAEGVGCDDCGTAPWCGDTACNGTETCSTCPGDCGVCPVTSVVACQLSSAITIDGDPSDWPAVAAAAVPASSHVILANAPEAVTANNDCSAELLVAWNSTHLYLLAIVTDDAVRQDSVQLYVDDGVEIYVDGGHEAASSYDANDFQIAVTADNRVDAALATALGVVHATVASAGGYVVEVALPWSALGVTPADARVIGFDVAVNDDDDGGDSRESQLVWAGDGTGWRDTSVFGDLVLTDTLCGTMAADGGPLPDGGAGDSDAPGGDGATSVRLRGGCTCGNGASASGWFVLVVALRRRRR